MESFRINNELWQIDFVRPDDEVLIDRTDKKTVATTDPNTHMVYLSTKLRGDFLMRVFLHELSHCVMISYGMIDEIRQMVYPEYQIKMEEWICNYVSNFGRLIYKIGYKKMGSNAWKYVVNQLDKYIKGDG